VVCMDAAKDRAVLSCMHVCMCDTCAPLLMLEKTPMCPVCREPTEHQTGVLVATGVLITKDR
jgi:RNA polymerase subunit RPABC4/transcription elongation factor Spt4